jgi:hypothetical protein
VMDPPDSGFGGPWGVVIFRAHSLLWLCEYGGMGGCPTQPTLQTPHIPSAIVLYL